MLAIALTAAASASAQDYTIQVQVDRPVVEPGEFARIVFAPAFDTSRDWAMGGVNFDMQSSAGREGFSDLSAIVPWSHELGPAPCDGGWCGILVGQLNFPPAGIYADPRSPLPAYGMTYTAPAVTEPTEVSVETRTNRYMVYVARESSDSVSRLDELTEGHATILVVPCRADFDLDGDLNIFDFLAFQNAFVAGDPMADFDFDGELTLFDFLAFQNRFDRGC
jgi:hypothetical protein